MIKRTKNTPGRLADAKLPVDLIFTSDWHLREDVPVSRTDDFQAAQWDKVHQVAELQRKYQCPVIHAGDLFHHWKPSPYLLAMTIQYLPEEFYTVYGQHDLPQHNFELRNKSGIYALETAGSLQVLDQGSWNQDPGSFPGLEYVGVSHRFVWDGKKVPWPDCTEITAKELLEKYPDFEVIVTGDHHKPFVYELDGRILVNCGCLTRQGADYADHRPRVWLYSADHNMVVPHYLNIDTGVVSREHLETKKQRDQRLEAFISRLSTEYEMGFSFEDNLKSYLSKNHTRKNIIELVYKSIES